MEKLRNEEPGRAGHRPWARTPARRVAASVVGVVAAGLMVAGSVIAVPAQAEESTTEQTLAVGQAVPAFELTGSDGETYAVSQLKDKKSLVLVFFRGTW